MYASSQACSNTYTVSPHERRCEALSEESLSLTSRNKLEGELYGLTIQLSDEAFSEKGISLQAAFFLIAEKLKPVGFVPLPSGNAYGGPHGKQGDADYSRTFLCLYPRVSNLLVMHEAIEALQELLWLKGYSAHLEAFKVSFDKPG